MQATFYVLGSMASITFVGVVALVALTIRSVLKDQERISP